MVNLIVLIATGLAGLVLFWPRLRAAALWRASMTPLASIIGSGFLVLGPILTHGYGRYAPLVMGGLCLAAYLLGGAIRFNIRQLAIGPRSRTEEQLEAAASWALAFAYIISVAYYLNLLGAFSVSLTPFNTDGAAKTVTSAVFLVILAVGWRKGFRALERLEQVSVGVKLAIIAGLLAGLGWYFGQKASAGALVQAPATLGGWQAVTLAFGLLVTVQGFETARYLGAEYSPEQRVRAMRLAQLIASGIYVVYIALFASLFAPQELNLSETAIIDLMGVVAPILPLMLVCAAISAQFSAAVADTGGSGGLLAELTRGRVSVRGGYLLLVSIGVGLTWMMSVFEIISYASRAFALYYGLQAAIAARGALPDRPARGAGYAALACLALCIALFGASVE